MNDKKTFDELRMLAFNLASLWNGGREVLDRLSRTAGDPSMSPCAALTRLGPEGVEEKFDAAAKADVSAAVRELTRYLASPTWFDRVSPSDERLRRLSDQPIAYFCMEYGLASWLPIYSGGLGILAGDMVKEASDMGLPLIAIGLFYRHGFFYQQLDETYFQTEVIPSLDPSDLPLERVVDGAGDDLLVSLPIGDRIVHVCAWKLQVGRASLYLLDTDVPSNSADDRAITASLYGGNGETRIQQEMVLGIGGMRLLQLLGIEPALCSLNEGHAALLAVELVAEELPRLDFPQAVNRARNRIVYTNHTVVPAGNDVFPRELISRHLSRYATETGFGLDRLLALARGGDEETFSMAILAFNLSGKANAVSELHSHVIPREWPGYAVEAVTNGVHAPTWVGPAIGRLLEEYVPDCRGDNPDWNAIQSIPDHALVAARDEQRALMIDIVNRVQGRAALDRSTLTIVWARRFAEYKRAGMIASDLSRLSRLLGSEEHPVQIIIAGKAHPRDEGGKRMLQNLLTRVAEDEVTAARVAFVPDYDERVARYLTMGADVWLNTPRKPLEASGTSGMKSSDNGGLQLTVTDGWAAEVDWWSVGWGIDGGTDERDALDLYAFLEESIVPLFFQHDQPGFSSRWVAMMKNTMILTLSRYSARRMLLDYLYKLYLPLSREGVPARSDR